MLLQIEKVLNCNLSHQPKLVTDRVPARSDHSFSYSVFALHQEAGQQHPVVQQLAGEMQYPVVLRFKEGQPIYGPVAAKVLHYGHPQ
eukprot:6636784-Pyramimonas_sp.AAC.1